MRKSAPKPMTPERLRRRRMVFYTGVVVAVGLATWFLADMFWRTGGIRGFEWVLLVLFVILFTQIAVGFVTALLGFYVINRGGDSQCITHTLDEAADVPLASTAIIMPVFNEDVSRVFEGLRVMYRSLEETGQLAHFDLFILSDSNQPNQWIKEEVAWVELCKQVNGFGRIFYRKRRQQINKKAGNVADFLRRWGKRYRYMVVLDADSIMTGAAIVKLVRLMEKNPQTGLIQTAPRLIHGESLYARLQQFANRLYSPIFLAGLNYWQQHESNYWGHNAIIRVQPFIDHCSLPELPGSEPFGGRILSHDFVEAALMRKAGWQVWLAHDIEGTYEEGPPTLIDNAKRDRRWCQGNLQHAWLLTARGFRPANRIHLSMGVMAYLSSPLWLLFLVFSTLHAFSQADVWSQMRQSHEPGKIVEIVYEAAQPAALLPEALTLFLFTLFLLFVPKVISIISTLQNPDRVRSFGGHRRLFFSGLLEIAISVLLAPIHMLFNSKFVVFTLLGQGVSWVTQRRGAEDGTDWREAIITHGGQTLFGLIWGLSTLIMLPSFFLWLSPVLAGLVLSIPLSITLSSEALGRRARWLGLLLTPEEVEPPYELRRLAQNLQQCYKQMPPIESLRADYGLLQAVLDPYINAVHVSLLRHRKPSEESREWFAQLRQRVLAEGPGKLTVKEKLSLLLDAESMILLHEELWRQPGTTLAEWWRLGMRQYNVLTTAPTTALYR